MSERNEAKNARKQAKEAVRRGDLVAAEKWSKVAERLAALPEEAKPIDENATRNELRRRLALYVDADRQMSSWEEERELYEANLAAAIANNTEPPAPLRQSPGGELSHLDYLSRIAREGY